jgi:hypothetical protein
VLDVQGYDLILGIDWLSSFGQMIVDWSKGMQKLKHKGKQVILQVLDLFFHLGKKCHFSLFRISKDIPQPGIRFRVALWELQEREERS